MTQNYDNDLQSIQEARSLAEAAYEAQQKFFRFSQEQVDRVCQAMADAAYRESARLGQMASEETGYGIPRHKMLKNHLGSKFLWEAIKNIKTVGVINEDRARGIIEIGWPMGVVAAVSPSTNPTSTVMYKTLVSVKARNGVVHAPHPAAAKCCVETARVMAEAGEAAGMPHGLVGCMSKISLPGSQELMRHKRISVIVATGGSEIVRVAHSMGKPAYGVGPGNVPCYVDRSADIKQAAYYIVSSKAFDNSVICATEQAVIADKPIAAQLRAEMERLGAYFVNPEQAAALATALFSPTGVIYPRSVGQTPQKLAEMAGIQIPASAKILVAPLSKVGKEEPLSREKLTTVLGWYEADGWEAGCERCIEMIRFGGRGHTLVIHATDENVILQFGLEKPVFRILVNTMGTLGSVGYTTNLMPSMTLGSGGIGGSISGDNITTTHLMNIKRVAYGVRTPPAEAMVDAAATPPPPPPFTGGQGGVSQAEVEAIVRAVIEEVLGRKGGY
ncbi:MAG: acetaldehyde dehydrogenase [Anaerolineae bacterium]|nr:aldehyde dehydrogenase family protein [Anaerolineales bacterium]MCQ3979415.1 acetaldehyde dehydrogenase [Anaerolineae bacterium]